MAKKNEHVNVDWFEEQANALLKMAEDAGLASNLFFATTFERYKVQLRILKDLEKALDENGTLVTKEYVKGRGNLYSNPAIQDYNRTTDSANKTVSTLLRILKSFEADISGDESDPLMDALNGGDADGEQ